MNAWLLPWKVAETCSGFGRESPLAKKRLSFVRRLTDKFRHMDVKNRDNFSDRFSLNLREHEKRRTKTTEDNAQNCKRGN